MSRRQREDRGPSSRERKLAEVLQLAQVGSALAQPEQERAARAQEMKTQMLLKVLGLGQEDKQFNANLAAQQQQAADTLGLRQSEVDSGNKFRNEELGLRRQEVQSGDAYRNAELGIRKADSESAAKARQGGLDLEAWSAGQKQMNDLAGQDLQKQQLELNKGAQQQAFDSKIFGDLAGAGSTLSPQMMAIAQSLSPKVGAAVEAGKAKELQDKTKAITPMVEGLYKTKRPDQLPQAISTLYGSGMPTEALDNVPWDKLNQGLASPITSAQPQTRLEEYAQRDKAGLSRIRQFLIDNFTHPNGPWAKERSDYKNRNSGILPTKY